MKIHVSGNFFIPICDNPFTETYFLDPFVSGLMPSYIDSSFLIVSSHLTPSPSQSSLDDPMQVESQKWCVANFQVVLNKKNNSLKKDFEEC